MTSQPQPPIYKQRPRIKSRDFGVTHCWPFQMVFAYTPAGTRLYTGSEDKIEKYVRSRGFVCHAMVHNYMAMNSRDPIKKHWTILGDRHEVFDLEHINPNKRKYFNRKHYRLMHTKDGVLGIWRRLPCTFLKELRDYQD